MPHYSVWRTFSAFASGVIKSWWYTVGKRYCKVRFGRSGNHFYLDLFGPTSVLSQAANFNRALWQSICVLRNTFVRELFLPHFYCLHILHHCWINHTIEEWFTGSWCGCAGEANVAQYALGFVSRQMYMFGTLACYVLTEKYALANWISGIGNMSTVWQWFHQSGNGSGPVQSSPVQEIFGPGPD